MNGAKYILLTLLIAADLFLLPAVSRLPSYLSDPGVSAPMERWQKDWLFHPIKSAIPMLLPKGQEDETARQLWLVLQLLVGAGGVLLLWSGSTGMSSFNKKGVPNPDESGAHGTARWRKPGELAHTLLISRFRMKAPPSGLLAGVDREKGPGKAYLIPGANVKGSKTNPHVLVLGGSGAGKTRRLVFPTLWLLGQGKEGSEKSSIVLTDPKGELYSYTADYFRSQGYRVETLNLIQTKRSSRYNPLEEVEKAIARGAIAEASDAAWDLAYAFTAPDESAGANTDTFWTDAAQSIVAAAVLYVASRAPEGQRTMASVYRLITELGAGGGESLDALFQSISDIADPSRIAYKVTQLSADKTRSSILTTAAVKLKLFAEMSIAAMTSGTDYELESIGKQPTVIYLLLPDDKSSKNAVAALYIQQMYGIMTRLAGESPGGRLPVPVYFLLDEFANIGKFKDFDKIISVARGRGISMMIVLQALQQLTARYGEETADVISANCDTWLFLKTNDLKTAEQISKKMGECTIRTRSGSANYKQNDFTTGSSEQLQGRPLMTPDEVLRWQVGNVLILQAGQYPVKLKLADISQWPAGFKENGPPPERVDPPAQVPWVPNSFNSAAFGGGQRLQVPSSSGSDRPMGQSLLDRIRRGGSQEGVPPVGVTSGAPPGDSSG